MRDNLKGSLPKKALAETLNRIDGRGFKAYKDIQGKTYDFDLFLLKIAHVQGDPFAAPSRVNILVGKNAAGFPDWFADRKIRAVALEDFLARRAADAIPAVVNFNQGSGKSGCLRIAQTGQEVLESTAADFREGNVELRIEVGLPASGRRILGRRAGEIFFSELPEVVRKSAVYGNIDARKLEEHVKTVEDQDFLRSKLSGKGIVAFIGNGSALPRVSGVDNRPLQREKAVEFVSPPAFETEMELPHRGRVKGMGISEGVTLVVGGGYHGKSTLLKAVEAGVYDHIPGDGRELVATVEAAVKIRAEDGRRVEKVDISPFIRNLPGGIDTASFEL